MATYRDDFPIGTRVTVHAGPTEGTDQEFNGKTGKIVEYKGCLAVKFDTPLKYWPNPYLISLHNLQKIGKARP